MKKILFLLIIVVLGYGLSYGQTTGYIRNDTIKLTNAAKNTILVIESASRGHNWYLKDIGNGRTQFVEATIADINHLQDSLANKANDTAVVHLARSESITGSKTFTNSTIFTPTITGNSGTNTPPFIYSPTINQSGTAQYNIFRISPYIQNLGNTNEAVQYLLDIGYRSGAFPSGTHTSMFTFSKTGNFSAASAIATHSSVMDGNGVTTQRMMTTGTQAQGVGTVENSGMLADFKAASMGTNLYQGMPTVSLANAQAVYVGIPTFDIGKHINNSVATIVDASTMTIAGPPVPNDINNVFTNKWSLRVASGNSYFGGNVRGLLAPNNPLDLINKRSADSLYTAHLATVAAMQAYTGTATTVFVTDTTGSGGLFSLQYNAAIDTNRFNKFAATAKGAGYYWRRKADESNGINVLWNPAVKADANALNGTHTTDNKAAIQAIIDYYPKKSAHLYFPRTYPYSFGISGPLIIGQNTYIEGETAFIPMQATSDTLKFSPQSAIYAYNNTGAIISQTTDNYRPQAPILRNIGIFGTGKTNNTNGIDLPRNNAYTSSNVNYRDLGVPVFDNVFIDGFTTGVDLKLANDAQFRYCHFTNTRVGVRNGKNANHFYRCDFFTGRASASTDTAAILKGNGLYVEDCVIEPGSSGMGMFLDSVSNSHFINNHIYNVSKGLVFRQGCYENIISGNQFITAGTGLTIANAGKNNAVLDNQFSFYTVTPVSITSTSQVVLNGNTFGEPLNSTHAAISASGSSLLMGNNNLNDYTDANKLNVSTTTFLTNNQFNNTKIINSAPSVSLYNPGSSSASPSYLSSGVDVGANYFDAYSGSGNRHVAYTTGLTLENHSSSAAGTDVAFYGTAPGSTTPVLAGQIGTQGLRLLFTGRAAGDMLVGNIANPGYYGRLGIGTSGQILTVVSGMPAWSSSLTSGITATTQAASDNSTKIATTAYVTTAKRLVSYTVATLPASPTAGDQAAVTDATAPTYLGTLTGGGSTYTPVVYNGTAWVAH